MIHMSSKAIRISIITVAVVAIAGVAFPAWKTWQLRGEIEHGVMVASSSLPEIEKFYASRGRLPRHSGEVGVMAGSVDPSIEYVTWRRSADEPERVGYLDVQMTLKTLGAGMTPFVLEARVEGKGIHWRCVSARRLGVSEEHSVADFYLPAECRQGPERQEL